MRIEVKRIEVKRIEVKRIEVKREQKPWETEKMQKVGREKRMARVPGTAKVMENQVSDR
jgi:metal-sulfur cluster biosynthetic enzyme